MSLTRDNVPGTMNPTNIRTADVQNSGMHRRELLIGLAGSAGALAAASLAQADDARWAMKLSTSTIHFKSLPVERAIERIAGLGFEAVDIWSAHAGCRHLDDVLERVGAERLTALLAEHRVRLFAFSVYQGGYAKYAKLLGDCDGGVAIQGSAAPTEAGRLTTAMKAFFDGLAPLAELAEKHDSYLAIENHGHALLDSLDSFRAFVELNPYKRIGIALAPYHIQRRGESVEAAIAIAGRQLRFFYAWQAAPGAKQLPGVGPTDCRPWLAALAQVRYGGYVNPFMHHEPEPDAMAKLLAQSREYLIRSYEQLP